MAAAAAISLVSCSKSAKESGSDAAADKATPTESATEAPAVVEITGDVAIPPADGKLRVLDFNATWCGPCKQFGPTFEAAAAKYAGKADFVSVDVDVCPQTAEAFGISSIPCVKVLRPDGTVETYQGTDELLPESKFFAIVDAGLK